MGTICHQTAVCILRATTAGMSLSLYVCVCAASCSFSNVYNYYYSSECLFHQGGLGVFTLH